MAGAASRSTAAIKVSMWNGLDITIAAVGMNFLTDACKMRSIQAACGLNPERLERHVYVRLPNYLTTPRTAAARAVSGQQDYVDATPSALYRDSREGAQRCNDFMCD